MDQTNAVVAAPADKFDFAAGTGVVRVKLAPGAKIIYGRIALPGFGQCYVDGLAKAADAQLKLTVKAAQNRRVVATITIPAGNMDVREGELRETGKGGKKWRVIGTLRETDGKWRLALRLPEVKIAQPKAF
jgi:hypothetical protein